MAQTHVTSRPSPSKTLPGRGPPAVTLIAANGVIMDRRRPTSVPSRPSRWIVQSVMLATSAFALLDLYLLTASVHP